MTEKDKRFVVINIVIKLIFSKKFYDYNLQLSRRILTRYSIIFQAS